MARLQSLADYFAAGLDLCGQNLKGLAMLPQLTCTSALIKLAKARVMQRKQSLNALRSQAGCRIVELLVGNLVRCGARIALEIPRMFGPNPTALDTVEGSVLQRNGDSLQPFYASKVDMEAKTYSYSVPANPKAEPKFARLSWNSEQDALKVQQSIGLLAASYKDRMQQQLEELERDIE